MMKRPVDHVTRLDIGQRSSEADAVHMLVPGFNLPCAAG